MNPFKDVVVKEGYTLLALVSDGAFYHAIINRNSKYEPYVYCYGYDITDGVWGQGHYYDTYAEAANDLAHHIGIMED